MDPQVIKKKIKQIIYETANIKPEDIGDKASFVEELKLDSLTLMEIAVNIEQEFDLDIPEEDMERFTDVDASIELVLGFGQKQAN